MNKTKSKLLVVHLEDNTVITEILNILSHADEQHCEYINFATFSDFKKGIETGEMVQRISNPEITTVFLIDGNFPARQGNAPSFLGPEAAKAVSEKYSGCPVVFYSADCDRLRHVADMHGYECLDKDDVLPNKIFSVLREMYLGIKV